jgi:DNA-binding Xre family transcriptional regulator
VSETSSAFVARVARQLRQTRIAKGITNEQLAERLDTAEQNVRRMLRAQNMTLATLRRVCAALGVRPEVTFVDEPGVPRKLPVPGRRGNRKGANSL